MTLIDRRFDGSTMHAFTADRNYERLLVSDRSTTYGTAGDDHSAVNAFFPPSIESNWKKEGVIKQRGMRDSPFEKNYEPQIPHG